jgi:hypothetical protein
MSLTAEDQCEGELAVIVISNDKLGRGF